jgi:transposase
MRKLHLSEQRGETAASLFRKSIEAEHPRLRERLLALALIAEGLPATAVARRLGRHRITVEQWVHQYNEHGLAGLTLQFRGQPGTRLTPAA